jgi:hypothetical protein
MKKFLSLTQCKKKILFQPNALTRQIVAFMMSEMQDEKQVLKKIPFSEETIIAKFKEQQGCCANRPEKPAIGCEANKATVLSLKQALENIQSLFDSN